MVLERLWCLKGRKTLDGKRVRGGGEGETELFDIPNSRHYIDECPCPSVIPEWKYNTWVLQHTKGLQEVCRMEASTGYHIRTE